MYYFHGTSPFLLFAIFNIIGCVFLMFLPFDTSGRELDSLVGEEEIKVIQQHEK